MLTASVSRKAGGVFDGVRRLSQSLHMDHGVDIEVLSLEDEYTAEDIATWSPLTPRTYPVRVSRQYGYARGLGKALKDVKTDIVHSHGLWMYTSTAAHRFARRAGCPRVVSAHGMLDPWAVHNAQWKKKIAVWLYEDRHLKDATCIRALTLSEAESIRAYGVRNPICVIPNGIDLPRSNSRNSPSWKGKAFEDKNVLLYLGRIHPKKGLLNLVRAWSVLKKDGSPSARTWVLAVAGWDQGGHEEDLKRLAEGLGASDIHFVGPQFGDDKNATYAHADAFVLPSLSEGLPMTVLEAWAYALPVVMTAECSIPEGFQADAAVCVETDVESIARGIRDLFGMSEAERRKMGARGCALVCNRFVWSMVACEMKSVYQWILGGGAEPACVIRD